jgi:hypothetical protein
MAEIASRTDQQPGEMALDSEDARRRFARMEQDAIFEGEHNLEQVTNRLNDLGNLIESMMIKCRGLEDTRRQATADCDEAMQNQVQSMSERMKAEERVTEELIVESEEPIRQYQPKFHELHEQLEKMKAQHIQDMLTLKGDDARNADRDEKMATRSHDDRISLLRQDLSGAKRRLKQAENDRDKALEEARQAQHWQIGSVMDSAEDVECSRLEQINNLRKNLDQQQWRLSELHALRVMEHNKRQADAILKLKEAHELRKQQIIRECEVRVVHEIACCRGVRERRPQPADEGYPKAHFRHPLTHSNALRRIGEIRQAE